MSRRGNAHKLSAGVYTDSPAQFRSALMRAKKPSLTAAGILLQCDPVTICSGIEAVMTQGGAVMLGQTRDQGKLIVTVYLEGDRTVEYCDDPNDVNKIFAELAVEGA